MRRSTSRTSSTKNRSRSMPYPIALSDTSSTDMDLERGVPMEYSLFSQMKTMGRFQSAARPTPSWNPPVATEHVVLAIEHVHRSAEALRAPRRLPEKLRQERSRGHSLCERDAVIAI